MEREQITKEDFEVVRKGWDPDAVRAHLAEVAASWPDPAEAAETAETVAGGEEARERTLGDVAAGRVRTVLEAAEVAAADIESSSKADADKRVADAQAEADRRVHNLEEFTGQTIECKVIELNRSRNNVVLSRRAVLEDERKEVREQILTRLQPGQIVEGKVSNIVDFGAIVDRWPVPAGRGQRARRARQRLRRCSGRPRRRCRRPPGYPPRRPRPRSPVARSSSPSLVPRPSRAEYDPVRRPTPDLCQIRSPAPRSSPRPTP
ncbi:MAG: hypothetical protein U0R24_09075 [Solirubrobacterales bacterium]